MVSKIIKKTPTKSIRSHLHNNHQRRGRKKSPLKNSSAASAVVASFYTCQRRLAKFFKRLACIGTPRKSPRKKGYQLLEKSSQRPKPQIRKCLFSDPSSTLPPLLSPTKKTVFLDLDETLVHSRPNPPPEKFDFIVRPVIEGEKVEFFVLKRPFVDEFLEFLSSKFEIVVFTAGIEEYASLVIDRIDTKRVISHRLYRGSCKEVDGKYVKDLSDLGRDLSRVVIVDDNPNSYTFQPENAVPILPFMDDLEDHELKKLINLFEDLDKIDDLRKAVKDYVSEQDKLKSET